MIIILYTVIFFLYLIFGYDFIPNMLNKQKLSIVNLKPSSQAFLFRRLIKLSFVAILLSIMFFNNPTINNYLSVSIIHVVIIVCFYLKWGLKDPSEYLLHILTALPVLFYPCFYNLIITPLNCSPFITIIVLIFYSLIQDLIYLKT
jgi:hypothetical protein